MLGTLVFQDTSRARTTVGEAILSPRAEIAKPVVNIESVSPFLAEQAHPADAVHPI